MTANAPRIYLDACVLLSYVNDAPDRADVVHSLLEDAEDGKVLDAHQAATGMDQRSLLEDAEDGKVLLFASNLSIAEVAYIASDQEPSSGTDDEAAVDGLWTPDSPVKLAEFSRLVAHTARSIIRKARDNETARVRSADAVHLATADISECDLDHRRQRPGHHHVHLATADISECDCFYTYESQSTRDGWDNLIQADVSEPYVDAPRLPSGDH